MVRIRWTYQAKDDLKSIAEYISRDSIRYARLQIYRIRNRTRILQRNPQAGREVPEIKEPKIRELIQGNYRIIYKIVTESRIDILTIHHSARDLTSRTI